jgi:hypothetical protein
MVNAPQLAHAPVVVFVTVATELVRDRAPLVQFVAFPDTIAKLVFELTVVPVALRILMLFVG